MKRIYGANISIEEENRLLGSDGEEDQIDGKLVISAETRKETEKDDFHRNVSRRNSTRDRRKKVQLGKQCTKVKNNEVILKILKKLLTISM